VSSRTNKLAGLGSATNRRIAPLQAPRLHGQEKINRNVKSQVAPSIQIWARRMRITGTVKVKVNRPETTVKDASLVGGTQCWPTLPLTQRGSGATRRVPKRQQGWWNSTSTCTSERLLPRRARRAEEGNVKSTNIHKKFYSKQATRLR